MSNLLFATPKDVTGWLSKLASGKRVLAPRQEGPSVVFRAYTAKELAAADVNALLKRSYSSPKQAMLPQCETLVAFKSEKDPEDMSKLVTTVENPCVAEATVVFGGRPCDARGFVVLDRPYLGGKFKDPYYAARREATAIVTQACPTAMNGCFCNWVGSRATPPTVTSTASFCCCRARTFRPSTPFSASRSVQTLNGFRWAPASAWPTRASVPRWQMP